MKYSTKVYKLTNEIWDKLNELVEKHGEYNAKFQEKVLLLNWEIYPSGSLTKYAMKDYFIAQNGTKFNSTCIPIDVIAELVDEMLIKYKK